MLADLCETVTVIPAVNQELALAAGGYSDTDTREKLTKQGISVYDVLQDNDAYHALERTGGLIITGATDTNVNDVAMLLIRR